jgi:metal-responsive CopG/Arc/MetJ family transcriptional regulator
MAMAKINISLPDGLLEQVDAIAAETHGSRSGFVAEATARYVASIREERAEAERRERIDRAIKSAREIGKKVGSFDSTASIRADRDRDGRPGDPQ